MIPRKRYIETNDQLTAAAEDWRGPIALDTEFMRTRTFYSIPGLYQIAAEGFSDLLDPLGIDEWAAFVAILENNQPIIMHSSSEDLELLHTHLGVQPRALFDTQVAFAFVNDKFSCSYAGLVEELLGVQLDKGATRSNWLKRPLSNTQLHYAHEDVAYLVPLQELLLERQESLGRLHWCEQEMRKRCRFTPSDPESYYLNIGAAWRLQDHQLGALRALCAWREYQARSEDVPRNKVVVDEHLFEFARRPNLATADLEEYLPARLRQLYARAVLDAHARGSAELDGLKAVPAPLTSASNKLVARLRKVAKYRAEQLDMAPELLARKREVERFVREMLACGTDSLHNYDDWRAQIVGDDFRAELAKGYL